ncbi:MAG: universal stress protein [Microlunatus sp.]|nr:universal stress protein [Microlunatus sp.]MDN5769568.1 universal stress protein [Microlunatus sp.]
MARAEVVVGLDNSMSARAALRWAARQARLTGAVLRAVTIVDWSDYLSAEAGPPVSMDWLALLPDQVDPADRDRLQGIFDEVQPEAGWLVEFVAGDPGRVLVQASLDSELLVVGTGEHVGLDRLLVGSTSRYCLNHAACPVVMVPGTYANSATTESSRGGD